MDPKPLIDYAEWCRQRAEYAALRAQAKSMRKSIEQTELPSTKPDKLDALAEAVVSSVRGYIDRRTAALERRIAALEKAP